MPGRMNIEKYKRSNTNLTLSAAVECRNAISWMSTIKGTRLALTPWPLQFSFQNPVTLSSLSTKALLWGWPREVRTLKGLSKGVCLYCHHHPAPLCDKFFIIQLSTPAPAAIAPLLLSLPDTPTLLWAQKTAKLEWLINLRYFDDHQIVDQNSPTFRYFLSRQIQFIDANEKEEEYLLQLQEPY